MTIIAFLRYWHPRLWKKLGRQDEDAAVPNEWDMEDQAIPLDPRDAEHDI